MPPKRWVCLDVGETLIDETRVWACWAEVLGVTQLTFMAVLGVAIAEGDFRKVFDRLGVRDRRSLVDRVEARFGGFQAVDLYPDAVDAIDALRSAGFGVAITANQPLTRSDELRAIGIQPDVMAMSAEMGAYKPSLEFYAKTLDLIGSPDPSMAAYVGDRLDNDVRPAAAAGMRAVWLRRGPWAALEPAVPAEAALVVDSLSELVDRLGLIF